MSWNLILMCFATCRGFELCFLCASQGLRYSPNQNDVPWLRGVMR